MKYRVEFTEQAHAEAEAAYLWRPVVQISVGLKNWLLNETISRVQLVPFSRKK
jgi:hypothetical protein